MINEVLMTIHEALMLFGLMACVAGVVMGHVYWLEHRKKKS